MKSCTCVEMSAEKAQQLVEECHAAIETRTQEIWNEEINAYMERKKKSLIHKLFKTRLPTPEEAKYYLDGYDIKVEIQCRFYNAREACRRVTSAINNSQHSKLVWVSAEDLVLIGA